MLKIAPDKWKHFFVGIAMGLFFQIIDGWLFSTHLYGATGLTLAVILAISYGWELLSKITGKGHYEIMDAVASVIGGLTGMGVIMLLMYWFDWA